MGILRHIIQKEDGPLDKEGQGLAVDVVELAELPDVGFFENGA